MADVKNQGSEYLARARKKKEAIIVTHQGKPYALIQPLSSRRSGRAGVEELAKKRLARAWEGDEDALYDYL